MKDKILLIKEWIQRYERRLSSLALLTGFLLDAFTLKRIDQLYGNILFSSYFLIVMICILLIHIFENDKNLTNYKQWVLSISPLVLQFAFGGLFSGFTVFYFRSGSLTSSWPFIIILLSLLLGNELLRRHYTRLIFQITVFFTALFFYLIFFIPVIIHKIGAIVFFMSGVIAILFIAIFIYLLFKVEPERVLQSRKHLIFSISFTFILINIFYFTNSIPPIPLSLKDAGVYHNLLRTSSGYSVLEEKSSYFNKLQLFDNINLIKGSSLYAYSSVFAPTNIKTQIVHNWQYFDTNINRWVQVSKITYTIIGGNDRGYRGYSLKTEPEEGKWRVNVETNRGQVIGRVLFEVIYVDKLPELINKEL